MRLRVPAVRRVTGGVGFDSRNRIAIPLSWAAMTDTLNNETGLTEADPATDDASPEVTTESVVEAILMSTDAPLSASKIAQILGAGDASDVKGHIARLNERYGQSGASFRIESIAKGYQLLTLPAYNHWVRSLHKSRADSRLSPAALETLAVVAYKQPVLRADIEAVRGVAAGDMLVRLRELNLVKIVGRAEEIGRPLLYGTTKRFLEVFGLGSLKDLPRLDEDNPGALPALRPVSRDAGSDDASPVPGPDGGEPAESNESTESSGDA